MLKNLKLYMLLLGCRPPGRHTEQHDIFFGIAPSLKSLVPQLKKSWPEAKGIMHIDAWRIVQQVEGYEISIVPKMASLKNKTELFFINLGGYLPHQFDERHYKIILPATSIDEAKKAVKQHSFFETHDLAHIDDKFGLDIDEIFPVNDILITGTKDCYIKLRKKTGMPEDEMHLGYFPLGKLDENW